MAYLGMWVYLWLDLLSDDKLGNLVFHSFYCQVKSLRDFSHVNHLVWCNILNESFASDLRRDLLKTSAEIEVKLHLRGDLCDLPLEIHVFPVKEILNDILCLGVPS